MVANPAVQDHPDTHKSTEFEQVERAVARALARVPTDRFASTAELARAVEADATTAPPATRSSRAHFRRRGALLLALSMLLGLGVLFGWIRSRGAAPHEEFGLRRVVVLPFDNLATTDKVYFAEGITDEIRGKLATVAARRITTCASAAALKLALAQTLIP